MKIIGTEKEILFIQKIFQELICDDCIYQEECNKSHMKSCGDIVREKVDFELIK